DPRWPDCGRPVGGLSLRRARRLLAGGDALRHPGGPPPGQPAAGEPGDRPDPPDPRALLLPAPPAVRRPHVWLRPGACREAGADPPVAARSLPTLRTPHGPNDADR